MTDVIEKVISKEVDEVTSDHEDGEDEVEEKPAKKIKGAKGKAERQSSQPPPQQGHRGGKRAAADDEKPKRALSAFFLFSADKRPSLPAKFKGKLAASELGRLWKLCSEKEKKPFTDLAAKNKIVSDKEIEAWKSKHGESSKSAMKGSKRTR